MFNFLFLVSDFSQGFGFGVTLKKPFLVDDPKMFYKSTFGANLYTERGAHAKSNAVEIRKLNLVDLKKMCFFLI